MHTAEPLVHNCVSFKVGINNKKLKRYISHIIDQILPKVIQARDNTLHSVIHKLIHFTFDKKELPQQWKESIIVFIYEKGDKTEVIIEEYHC
jgi:hypothetical protein